jgi:hypothetical protein
MTTKPLALTLVLLLSFSASLPGQSTAKEEAERIRRYERMGSGGDAIMEANSDLMHFAGRPDDRVAVRVCSKGPMPLALSIAATDPFLVAKLLKEGYSYSPDRILFLRSEDCLGSDPKIAATELWAIPKGATLPASVESVRSNQVRLESIGVTENTPVRGARNYRAAVQELITKLRARPQAVGLVLGYYYRRPSLLMQRRLRKVRRLLEQSGLSQDRYFVRLAPWNGEYGTDPPDPEPRYASVSIIEVTRDSARR